MNKNYNVNKTRSLIHAIIKASIPSYNFNRLVDENDPIGHTFKLHRTDPALKLLPVIKSALKVDGQTWFNTSPFYYKKDKSGRCVLDKNKKKIQIQSDWIGIRSQKFSSKK